MFSDIICFNLIIIFVKFIIRLSQNEMSHTCLNTCNLLIGCSGLCVCVCLSVCGSYFLAQHSKYLQPQQPKPPNPTSQKKAHSLLAPESCHSHTVKRSNFHTHRLSHLQTFTPLDFHTFKLSLFQVAPGQSVEA